MSLIGIHTGFHTLRYVVLLFGIERRRRARTVPLVRWKVCWRRQLQRIAVFLVHLRTVRDETRDKTRELSREWTEQHVRPRLSIFSDGYGQKSKESMIKGGAVSRRLLVIGGWFIKSMFDSEQITRRCRNVSIYTVFDRYKFFFFSS